MAEEPEADETEGEAFKVTDGYFTVTVLAETAQEAIEDAVGSFRCDDVHLDAEPVGE